MTFIIVAVNFAGAVALLLWGTHMVQTGVQRAFGPKLRSALGSALRNRISAFLAGMGVTALLQSSTATGLMVTGFTAAGIVSLVTALAVMLGANVGSTLIVQVFSFNVTAFSPALILVGVLLFRRNVTPFTHDLGRVFIGLGLMLMALHLLLGLLTPYENEPGLRMMLGAVSTVPVLDVLLGAVATWAVHSSVAVVLLIMPLAAKGVISLQGAFAFVIGANLGTAINPVLEGATGNDRAARRLPIGNLLVRVVGAVVALIFLDHIINAAEAFEPDPTRAVADFHTMFNLGLALAFLPVLGPFGRLLTRALPDRTDAADPSRPVYLDSSAREVPIMALGGASREALRLVDVLEQMLRGTREALVTADRQRIGEVRRLDDVLDNLNREIKNYLIAIDYDELSEADQRRLRQILSFTMNLEQAGDVVDRNLLPHATKRIKRGLAFSEEGQQELVDLMERLIANLRAAASVFMTDDVRAARSLAQEKVTFREAEAKATESHLGRIRSGRMESIRTSSLHLDLLRDMKLVNSHIVAAAAYPVLERTGELLPSRIARSH